MCPMSFDHSVAGCVRKEVNLQMSDWRVAWGHPPKSWDRFVDDDHGSSGNEYQAAHVHSNGTAPCLSVLVLPQLRGT